MRWWAPNNCTVVVYRVQDAEPDPYFPDRPLTRWRWELWQGDVFLTGQTNPGIRSETEAHKAARTAAEDLGYQAA